MSSTPQDQAALSRTKAGRRFIGMMTIYNGADEARLHHFVSESYHADLLVERSAEARYAELQTWRQQIGRLRVKQVLAAQEYHVIVAMEAEHAEGFFYSEMKVEEDYPHRIIVYMFTPLQASS